MKAKRLLTATGLMLASAPAILAAQNPAPVDLLPSEQLAEQLAEQPAKPASEQRDPRIEPAAPPETAGQPVSRSAIEDSFDAAITRELDPTVQTWSAEHAERLVDYIRTLAAEGLDPADYQLEALGDAIMGGSGAALDEAASQSFAWVVEDLRDGRTPMDSRKQWFVFDPDADRYPTGRLLTEALASGDIAGTLATIMPEHPDYALLRGELAKAKAGTKRQKLIRANMERWRWLPRDLGSQYLMTNVPEFQLRLTVNDQIISTYRTIVGKPGRNATPQMAEMVEGVIFNPTWTVPQSIVKGEGLGARVLGNPAWAKRKGYKGTRGANGWVTVVQQPGPTNSLGLMKLDMPNKHAIFLHDTPSRGLFDRTSRALSHGCIRTERASELAITMAILGAGLSGDEGVAHLTSRKYTKVGFTKKMPVYITYFTLGRDIEGEFSTFADIYGRDAPVIASLAAPRKANRSRVTGEQIIPIEDDMRIAMN